MKNSDWTLVLVPWIDFLCKSRSDIFCSTIGHDQKGILRQIQGFCLCNENWYRKIWNVGWRSYQLMQGVQIKIRLDRRHHVWDRCLFAEEIPDRDSIGQSYCNHFFFKVTNPKTREARCWASLPVSASRTHSSSTLSCADAAGLGRRTRKGRTTKQNMLNDAGGIVFLKSSFFTYKVAAGLVALEGVQYCTVARSTLPGESTQFVTHNFFTHKSQSFIHLSHDDIARHVEYAMI